MDTLSYILFKNPVMTSSWNSVKSLTYLLPSIGGGERSSSTAIASTLSNAEVINNLLVKNRNYIRLAGFFGASAVILSAYGAHTLLVKADDKDETLKHRKYVFNTAREYHFYHIVAFLAAPFCKFPKMTALTIASGLVIFCGSCYYQSLTGDETPKPITPYGGSLLILGWLTMLF